jgi:tetratricopeptide (TPR) repeat protein
VDVSKLLEKGREAAERRNYDYAIELYLQARKLAPDNAAALRELRAVENRMSKEKGTSFWSKTKTAGQAAQVSMLFMAKKYDAAIEKAEEALKADPGNVGVLMALGRASLAAGYRNAAIATFEDIKTMNAGGNNKQMVEALRELSHCYEADNRIKDAQDIWSIVAKLVPGDREATVQLRDLAAKSMHSTIETAAMSGQRGSAARSTQTEEQKKQAARLDREKGIGDIKTTEDLKLAIEDKKHDIAQRPDDPKNYSMLGDLYKQGGSYADAKKSYEQAREKDANNPTYLFKLHDLELWKMTNSVKALAAKYSGGDKSVGPQYEKEVMAMLEFKLNSYIEREKQYSTDSTVKFELGSTYFEMAQRKKDKTLFDESIKRFQQTFKDPKFRNLSGLRMGMGFAAKEQFDLALKRFDETLASIPSELKNDSWKNLTYAKADTLQKAGRREEAKKVFLEIYEIDVAFKDVAKRVDELSQGSGAAS